MNRCRHTSLPAGTVVITRQQSAGRGRRGKQWESAPGMNLTFSVLIYPDLSLKKQFALTQAVSLAIREYVMTRIQSRCQIKWPNDVVIGEKKIAGILIENIVREEDIEKSIIGIGININQNTFHSPLATSLNIETKRTYILSDELESLLLCLESKLVLLQDEKHRDRMHTQYISYMLGIEKEQYFYIRGSRQKSRIEGVTRQGELILALPEGNQSFQMDEIEWDRQVGK